MSRNLSHLSGRKGLKDNLFDRIGKLSEPLGTPDNRDLQILAEEFHVGGANLLGTASFYDFTRAENRGKKAYVCNGSACLLAGTQDAVKSKLTAHYGAEAVGDMCCLGRCHENAAFHVNGLNYSGNAIDQLDAIAQGHNTGADQYRVAALGRPVLTDILPGEATCRQAIRRMLHESPETLLNEIKTSGLRGRGGAGFPIAIKMATCRGAADPVKYVVCNADEGDPGAYSDRYLLEQQPWMVLLGMLIAGYAIGAHDGVLYIRYEYPESIAVIKKAIAELESLGLAGDAILGSEFNFHFTVIEARGAYICGEETALLASIEGQRPEVRVRPPYPAIEGLFGKPTIVNNVETLANLLFILLHGGAAFAGMGTERSTGTKLISLDSSFNHPGIYEAPMGTPLSVIVDELGGGFAKPVKALHIGGPLGGLVPVHKIKDLNLDFESFSQQGFLLGHASVIGVPEGFPMIQYLEHLFEFTAHESCGKCFPCRLGSTRGKELLQKASHENYRISRELFGDLLDTMEKGSLCALGGGVPLPVRNALQYFEAELAPYFS